MKSLALGYFVETNSTGMQLPHHSSAEIGAAATPLAKPM